MESRNETNQDAVIGLPDITLPFPQNNVRPLLRKVVHGKNETGCNNFDRIAHNNYNSEGDYYCTLSFNKLLTLISHKNAPENIPLPSNTFIRKHHHNENTPHVHTSDRMDKYMYTHKKEPYTNPVPSPDPDFLPFSSVIELPYMHTTSWVAYQLAQLSPLIHSKIHFEKSYYSTLASIKSGHNDREIARYEFYHTSSHLK